MFYGFHNSVKTPFHKILVFDDEKTGKKRKILKLILCQSVKRNCALTLRTFLGVGLGRVGWTCYDICRYRICSSDLVILRHQLFRYSPQNARLPIIQQRGEGVVASLLGQLVGEKAASFLDPGVWVLLVVVQVADGRDFGVGGREDHSEGRDFG